jgi:hypothetical protein
VLVRRRARMQHRHVDSRYRSLGEDRTNPGRPGTEKTIKTNAGTIHRHQCTRLLIKSIACSLSVSGVVCHTREIPLPQIGHVSAGPMTSACSSCPCARWMDACIDFSHQRHHSIPPWAVCRRYTSRASHHSSIWALLLERDVASVPFAWLDMIQSGWSEQKAQDYDGGQSSSLS